MLGKVFGKLLMNKIAVGVVATGVVTGGGYVAVKQIEASQPAPKQTQVVATPHYSNIEDSNVVIARKQAEVKKPAPKKASVKKETPKQKAEVKKSVPAPKAQPKSVPAPKATPAPKPQYKAPAPKPQPRPQYKAPKPRTDGFNMFGRHFGLATFYGTGMVPANNNVYEWAGHPGYYLVERTGNAGPVVTSLGYGSTVVVNGRTYRVSEIMYNVPNDSRGAGRALNLRARHNIVIQTCNGNIGASGRSDLTIWGLD